MRPATRHTARDGARRRSHPVPIALLLLGLLLVAGGVAQALREPPASLAVSRAPVVVESGPASPSATAPAAGSSSPAGPAGDASTEQAPPASVSLPGTKDRLPVVPVGVLPSGALQLPEHPQTLGWWSTGPLPGSAQGTVVLAGHLDSAQYGIGPLEALLAEDFRGGPVDVVDTAGGLHRYTASSRRSYHRAALPADLFSGAGPPRLAIVTCGGSFDRRTGQYSDNVVVYADPAPAA